MEDLIRSIRQALTRPNKDDDLQELVMQWGEMFHIRGISSASLQALLQHYNAPRRPVLKDAAELTGFYSRAELQELDNDQIKRIHQLEDEIAVLKNEIAALKKKQGWRAR